jgi:hypothetical protein
MRASGYTNSESSKRNADLEKRDPVKYWKQMRETRMNV